MTDKQRDRDLTEQLDALKKLNEGEKQKKARLEGKLDILQKRMEEYDCKTLTELETLLETKKAEEVLLSATLEKKIGEFDAKFKLED